MDVHFKAGAVERARYVNDQMPAGGLFAGATWRTAPAAFPLSVELVARLEALGPQLLAFYRASNVLYRHSVTGKLPRFVADYLDAGKPPELVELSRQNRFKSDIPHVIRPDVILTDDHFFITELDSVPGGIGLTGWLGKTYGELGDPVVGGPSGMMEGFASLFGSVPALVVVSEEAATYRPEMEWLGQQLGFRVLRPEELGGVLKPATGLVEGGETGSRLGGSLALPGGGRGGSGSSIMDRAQTGLAPAVYRFFELFDLANVANAPALMRAAAEGLVAVTPPFKPQLEEKMLFAFLWLRQLQPFWREQLGERTLAELQRVFPYTWMVDPAPLPPHAAIPELGIHDWRELGRFSQKQRELVLKISGFHPQAWGSRGVYVGHDLPAAKWTAAIEQALADFPHHPHILQRFEKSKLVAGQSVDFASNSVREFQGRARLCPYYFVVRDAVRLGGILATVCPADKKLLHGMPDAVLAPCRAV